MLLITGAFSWPIESYDVFKKMGFDVAYVEREDGQFDFDPEDIDAVICNWLFIHHDIEKFKNLKYIQLLSAGLDRVPLEYIKKHEITLRNAAGVYSIPMAEHALCGVLSLYRKSEAFFVQKSKRCWNKIRDLSELTGQTVCIVGAGNVGCAVARKFAAFTDKIFGIDLIPGARASFCDVYPLEKLDTVLTVSDVVILTLPLTQQTRHCFDEEQFSHMKDGSVFVNIARGGLVNEDALIKALSGGKLYGAVLDVFECEPLKENSVFWEMENVILTPHNSFVSNGNSNRMLQLVYSNLRQFKWKEQ